MAMSVMPNLYTDDVGRATAFYRDLIGGTETSGSPADGPSRHVELRVGDVTIALSSRAAVQEEGLPAPTAGSSDGARHLVRIGGRDRRGTARRRNASPHRAVQGPRLRTSPRVRDRPRRKLARAGEQAGQWLAGRDIVLTGRAGVLLKRGDQRPQLRQGPRDDLLLQAIALGQLDRVPERAEQNPSGSSGSVAGTAISTSSCRSAAEYEPVLALSASGSGRPAGTRQATETFSGDDDARPQNADPAGESPGDGRPPAGRARGARVQHRYRLGSRRYC